jgi:hypothetical protein
MVAMVHCSPMGVEGRPEKYSTNQHKSAINDGQERPLLNILKIMIVIEIVI